MVKDFFKEQDEFLSKLEADLSIEQHAKADSLEDYISKEINIPTIDNVDFSNWKELEKEWPTIDYDLFP